MDYYKQTSVCRCNKFYIVWDTKYSLETLALYRWMYVFLHWRVVSGRVCLGKICLCQLPEQADCFYYRFLSHVCIHMGWRGGCSVCVYYLELWCAPVCLLVNACIRRLIALYLFAGLVIDEKPDLKFVQSWVRANCKCSALSGSNSILCEVLCIAKQWVHGYGFCWVLGVTTIEPL